MLAVNIYFNAAPQQYPVGGGVRIAAHRHPPLLRRRVALPGQVSAPVGCRRGLEAKVSEWFPFPVF